ncbi:uncharacterized protein BYT42DRAFT_300134 [Radiomyces spectabilis]|uniref:uncharacterized protein n=1 Tax=Radiomyces spectabilis TaxID=64574 RepID=UPI00221EE797|nr:uncharacterized protein BYT42DRAFT_300134 [Radiomyces spectabilis]KAI8381289.1 hypothetical protein BYT42DRAFT_300134 [Radiomyces spectabilis]
MKWWGERGKRGNKKKISYKKILNCSILRENERINDRMTMKNKIKQKRHCLMINNEHSKEKKKKRIVNRRQTAESKRGGKCQENKVNKNKQKKKKKKRDTRLWSEIKAIGIFFLLL